MFSSIRQMAGMQIRNYAKKRTPAVALRSLKPKSSRDTVSCVKINQKILINDLKIF